MERSACGRSPMKPRTPLRYVEPVVRDGKRFARFPPAVIVANADKWKTPLVLTSGHRIVEGEVMCRCTFVLLWLHGPNAGSRTSTGIEHICLQQHGSAQVDPALDHFLELSKQKLESARQGEGCSYGQNLGQNIELLADYHSKKYTNLKDGDHFIWIENLEKDISPQNIVGFIYQKTSGISQVYVFPSFLLESHTRGMIFLEAKSDVDRLLCFLHNPEHIITSPRGRPWVIIERKWIDGSAGGLILKSEKQPCVELEDYSTRTKVVHEGPEEYAKAKRLQEVFIEFHERIRRLHKGQALEERNLMQPSP